MLPLRILPSRMAHACPGVIACLCVALGSAHADTLTFYPNRTSFDTSNPGLTVESFQNASTVGINLATATAPLTSATNAGVFLSGSVAAGLSLSNAPAANVPGLIVYPSGTITGAGTAVGTNWFGDTLVLGFDPGVTAVGVDVFAATGPGQTLPGSFLAQVFDGTTLVGSETVTEALGGFGFLGVSSTGAITSIDLLYNTNSASTLVSAIAFGNAGGSSAAQGSTGSNGNTSDTGGKGSTSNTDTTGTTSSTGITGTTGQTGVTSTLSDPGITSAVGSDSGSELDTLPPDIPIVVPDQPSTPAVTPEPATWTFTGLGLATLALLSSQGRFKTRPQL